MSGQIPTGGTATVVFSRERNAGVLVMNNVAPPKPGTVYQMWLVGANASKALQMISARIVIYEELSEYPEDTDGRGSPEDQALERTQAWSERGIKVVDCSTPGVGGKKHDGTLRCRVTALYQKSSRGRYFVRCPQCDHQQVLSFDKLYYKDEAPEAATYTCAGGACVIEHHQKADMVAAGGPYARLISAEADA